MILYLNTRQNGDVISYSQENNGGIKVTVSKIDFDKIIQNWRLKYTDKLEFEKPKHIEDEEKKVKIDDIKSKINTTISVKDIKDQLTELLTIITI